MTTSNAKVTKALSELGLRQEAPLTAEQEAVFKRATDSDEAYLYQVEQLFQQPEKE